MPKCIGCGATLQDLKEDMIGYVPTKMMNQKNAICMRCFKLRNYNENSKIISMDYLRIISNISKDPNALIIHVVDLFDFSSTFISSIKRQTGQADCILVGNKFDLLPKSVKKYKVINWMRHMCNLEDFKALEVLALSGKNGDEITELVEAIVRHYKKRRVYFVGCSNVGKSTILNTIIKKYTSETKDIITTSKIPGTTLDMIEIRLDGISFIDTPGIFKENQIIHQISPESYDYIMPKKEIKTINFQLNSDQTIFISGLAWVDYVSGDKTTMVFYFSDRLNIHRTKTKTSIDFFNRQVTNLLMPPTKDDFEGIKYYHKDIKIENDGKKYDIVISGLGFFRVCGDLQLRVTTIKGVDIYIREAII